MLVSVRFTIILSIAVAACTLPRAASQTSICAFPPVVAPGWYDWIYAKGVRPSARRELLPLYQQLDELQRLRLPVALVQVQDRAWDFLAAAAGAVNSKAAAITAQSATGQIRRENAATSADSPEAQGWNIGSDIRHLEAQIKTVRHKYHLDTTIGPAPKTFDVSSVFSNDGVQAWLQKSDCGQKLLEKNIQLPKTSTSCYDVSQRQQLVSRSQALTDACTAKCNRVVACVQACWGANPIGPCVAACGGCDDICLEGMKASNEIGQFDLRQAQKGLSPCQ
jgi:hypothetical protein